MKPGTLLLDFEKSDFRGILGAKITTRVLDATETSYRDKILYFIVYFGRDNFVLLV